MLISAILFLLVAISPFLAAFQNTNHLIDNANKKVTRVNYDEYTDSTDIFSDLSLLSLPSDLAIESMRLQLVATYKGRSRLIPDRVQIGLSGSRWSKENQIPHLFLIADGVKFDAGKTGIDTYHSVGAQSEIMYFALPTYLFLQIAQAQKISLLLNDVEIVLEEYQIKRLNDFSAELWH